MESPKDEAQHAVTAHLIVKPIDESQETPIHHNLDHLLSEIGFTRFHLISYFFFGIADFSAGFYLMIISLIQVVLEKDYNYSNVQLASTTMAFFLGSLTAGVTMGGICDKYGRRPLYQIFSLLFALCIIGSAFTAEYWVILGLRYLAGFSYSALSLALAPLPVEITPTNCRGKGLILLFSAISFGMITACFVARYLPVEQNWKWLLIIAACPMVISFFGSILFVKESIRWLFLNEKWNEALDDLNEIAAYNPSIHWKVCEKDISHIIDATRQDHQTEKLHSNFGVLNLFRGQYLRITIVLWSIRFVIAIVYYGLTFTLPLVLSQDNVFGNADIQMAVILLGEILAIPVDYSIIEHRSFGRKNSLQACFFIMGSLLILASISRGTAFVIICFLSTFFIANALNFLAALQAELYPTSMRSTGIGYAFSIGDIGCSLMPAVLVYTSNLSPYLPLAIFGILSIIGGIFTFFVPYDTTGKELDRNYLEDPKVEETPQEP
jgi:MFS family permease